MTAPNSKFLPAATEADALALTEATTAICRAHVHQVATMVDALSVARFGTVAELLDAGWEPATVVVGGARKLPGVQLAFMSPTGELRVLASVVEGRGRTRRCNSTSGGTFELHSACGCCRNGDAMAAAEPHVSKWRAA